MTDEKEPSFAERSKKTASIDVFRAACLIFSFYFLYVFHSVAGFPPSTEFDPYSIVFLVLFLFFFLLPSAKTLKLGKWLEYETRVAELKDEVRQHKEETSQLFALHSNLISTVSHTANQNVSIMLPGQEEVAEAKAELNRTIKDPAPPTKLVQEISDFLASEGLDLNLALAKLRMELEFELRRILDKRLETPEPGALRSRLYSVKSLFSRFVKEYPQYEGMRGSLDYILSVCNAAIHGQRISEGASHEALEMGLKILDELKSVASESD